MNKHVCEHWKQILNAYNMQIGIENFLNKSVLSPVWLWNLQYLMSSKALNMRICYTDFTTTNDYYFKGPALSLLTMFYNITWFHILRGCDYYDKKFATFSDNDLHNLWGSSI